MSDAESDSELSPEEQKALEEVADHVAQRLMSGATKKEVVAELVENEWEEEEAHEFVSSIKKETMMMQTQLANNAANEEGGAMGWVFWIGGLLLFNLLSWIFDWPIWIY